MNRIDDRPTTQPARPAWRRPGWRGSLLAVGLGLAVALSGDATRDDPAGGAAQAAPAPAPASAAPDLRVNLAGSDWRAAPDQDFSYRVTVTNHGNAAAPAQAETVLHPALGNVSVSSPGFSCTRQFAASGSLRGTLVSCTTWEPLQPGATATFTVRARTGSTPGAYEVAAAVAPRDGEDVSGTAVELRVAD